MRLTPILLALMALPSLAQTHTVTLATLRDNARPLLIFAPTPDDPQLILQLRRLQQTPATVAATTDRNIVLIAIPFQTPSPSPATLTTTDATAARHRFHIAPSDFAVILLGKDGGEKLRSSKPLTLQTLCDTIDAMPMRQQEMRSHPHP
jgi:hypothetical protein